jgi:DNA-binding IclR family transcriptional regulator
MVQQPGRTPYSSLLRGLAALEAIGDGERSISTLATRLGLDRSAMSRLVGALVDDGWVVRGPDGPTLGPRAAVLGRPPAGAWDPVHHARTLAHVTAGVTGCDVTVGLLSGRRGYQLAIGIGRQRLHEYPSIVEPFPLWATASGLATLSMLSDEAALARLPPEPLPAFTPRSITTHAGVRARLADIRARGLVVEREEFAPGVACVGVPWSVPGFTLPGAMTCIGPADHVLDRVPQLEQVLRRATSPGATESSVLGRSSS